MALWQSNRTDNCSMNTRTNYKLRNKTNGKSTAVQLNSKEIFWGDKIT